MQPAAPPSPALRRATVAWLVLVLGLGVAVRCRQYLACPSYWYDEAYLLLNVFGESFRDLAGPLDHDQVAPPLFVWLLRALICWCRPSRLWRVKALAELSSSRCPTLAIRPPTCASPP